MNKFLPFLFLALLSSVCAPGQPSLASARNSSAPAELKSSFAEIVVAPDKELIVVQLKNLNTMNLDIFLEDGTGKVLQETFLHPGTTMAYFDTQAIYAGKYVVKICNGNECVARTISVVR